jgi:hypothetical protein
MTVTLDDRILVTEAEAADLIGLTPRFLQARRHRGGGPPFVRISARCIRYQPSALRSWAEERVRLNTSGSDKAAHKSA